MDYLVNNAFGARGLRARPWNPELFVACLRSELLPFFRQDEARRLRQRARDLASHRKNAGGDIRPSMVRPGFFVTQGLPQLPVTLERDFFRINYQYYATPEDAVEDILHGAERCVLFKRNPLLSRFKLIAPLWSKDPDKLLRLSAHHTDHWLSRSDDKFFVSVSSRRFDAIDDANGNLRINLRSSRAFKIPETMSNLGEYEYGIPLIINPAEIVALELNFAGMVLFSSRSAGPRAEMSFHWNGDFTALRVAVEVLWPHERYDLNYVFDRRSGHYRRV